MFSSIKEFFLRNQQKLIFAIGYVLVFSLAFGLGRMSVVFRTPPDIAVEESRQQTALPTITTTNDTPEIKGLQSSAPALMPIDGECGGKIKGNISSSGKIYHMPGGAFYTRTQAEACFTTEAEAQAAGFRKSKN
ncbi:MAG: hypothetical protein A2722_03910 [Candidatus Doudnabacteria bacterium RIFCSPHIGHO2_01_FULL_50_11]|uniref:Ada DNA repair metal-binding domain-containing protein n=1 Tax=Candidatus Doudnabacteria bacterium RIFCSPHIGHO2_01_FULL_50_11 TaxID=1817828 RepID=A0A1F5PLV0_9BACT|nr:MAG: hypothetical protein A2722_03910 [Candidatus Doudnabacteria bacterium RIFCSPHIGHO2_01_FULL_50_11]HLC44372.1 hypothetical protein [Patescibacteria group bacterium]